ncbi:hypothetical protein F7O85_00515 [Vibrio panuliri]|uniref:Uncharacterized protein n=1 Tax=Vibrio panuliri TaxID=1381081 RepID=A0ABX3FFH2_9VIBR|nr:hypothetical protein [Vibrio panuliri]KAB1460892.1 hypothetical protein F7O85_00515 [Vibrio panuliri]OLQ91645.1 hypothetical protein BIY20_09590 [Vibrio panuliri]
MGNRAEAKRRKKIYEQNRENALRAQAGALSQLGLETAAIEQAYMVEASKLAVGAESAKGRQQAKLAGKGMAGRSQRRMQAQLEMEAGMNDAILEGQLMNRLQEQQQKHMNIQIDTINKINDATLMSKSEQQMNLIKGFGGAAASLGSYFSS